MADIASDPSITPTPERYQHSPIITSSEVITYDKDGRPSRSLAPRAVDTIGRMLSRGSITSDMAQAADKFRADFRKAHFDNLRCSDPSRTPISGSSHQYNVDADARAAINGACQAIGHPGWSAMWHIIGLEYTIKEWALEFQIHELSASGILVAALGTLARYYKIA